ncbi:hypothetical protein [Vibrio sp.]|uniref:hypothetical protein n=1 Tax=Vibrio sp. TaxID=678 RepID=UPI003F6CFFD8
MKKMIVIIAAISSALSHSIYAKVTLEDAYASEAEYYESVKQNRAEYEKDLYEGLEPPQSNSNENSLEYIGKGNMKLPGPGYYVVDSGHNSATSTVYVPSLVGTYYGTSGTTSNSAIGVKVVNGVMYGTGKYGVSHLTAIYRLK